MGEKVVEAERRFPAWLKKRLPAGGFGSQVRAILDRFRVTTVCQHALCPNQAECYAAGTATFMILGAVCTRSCRFCAVNAGTPAPADPGEPERVAQAARTLGLDYVVVTSVTRDDLPDGGAGHFAATIHALRAAIPSPFQGEGKGEGRGLVSPTGRAPHPDPLPHGERGTAPRVEVLTPDFQGRSHAIDAVVAARPEVYNHNVETVPRLYPGVRPQADYWRSLALLGRVRAGDPSIITKSGLMVGLSERPEEVAAVMRDLRSVGCQVLTIGQYLRPSAAHVPVTRFVEPAEFASWREEALVLGFAAVASGPFVRSSHGARRAFEEAANRLAGGARSCG